MAFWIFWGVAGVYLFFDHIKTKAGPRMKEMEHLGARYREAFSLGQCHYVARLIWDDTQDRDIYRFLGLAIGMAFEYLTCIFHVHCKCLI